MSSLVRIQQRVGVTPDGVWGPATFSALEVALDATTTSEIDTITALATGHLKSEESTVLNAYQDHLGFWTIGTGRLIDKRKGGGITMAENDILLANDIAKVRLQMAGWPSWERVKDDPVRAVAMISMCFQLGAAGLAGFTNTLGMIARGEFDAAAMGMLGSLWARQTPQRAKRVAEMMRTGKMA